MINIEYYYQISYLLSLPELTCLRSHRRVHCLLVYLCLQLTHQIKEFWHPLLYLWKYWLNSNICRWQVSVFVCVDIHTLRHLRFCKRFCCFLNWIKRRRRRNWKCWSFWSLEWRRLHSLTHLTTTCWPSSFNHCHHFLNCSFDIILQFFEFFIDFIFESYVL